METLEFSVLEPCRVKRDLRVTVCGPSNTPGTHAEQLNRAREVVLCLKLPLVPCIVYVNIEGSGETARMCSASPLHSLFAFVNNTLSYEPAY